MPQLTQPAYFEFTNNSYAYVFAEKGALIYSEIAAHTDSGTYSVFNFTGEKIDRVLNGAIQIAGNQYDTTVFF